jgi:hypothetical protein
MVSNYDRIFAEINKEAAILGKENNVDPELLVELVMEIVDLEDQNRTKPTRIKQLVEERIITAAQTAMSKEG